MANNNDDNYDPFNEVELADNTYARPRSVNTLDPGKEYKIIHVSQMKSQYPESDGSTPMNTVVQYFESGLKFQSILTKKFNNKSLKWIEAMNKLIANDVGPKLVYYGTISLGHEVELLRHTQGTNQEKLKTVQELMSKITPHKKTPTTDQPKRTLPLDFDSPPAKKPGDMS